MGKPPKRAMPGDAARLQADAHYAVAFEIREPTPDEQRRGVTRHWNGLPVAYVIDFLAAWTGNAFIEVEGYTPWATTAPADVILYWVDTPAGSCEHFVLSSEELRAKLTGWRQQYRLVANHVHPAKRGLLVPLAELRALQSQPGSAALLADAGWLASFNSFGALQRSLTAPREEDEWMEAFPDRETAMNWQENYDPD